MKNEITKSQTSLSDMSADDYLFNECSQIIERRKIQIAGQANSGIVEMFWEVGNRINYEILNNERAAYGKRIVASVSRRLEIKYGSPFALRNVRRMIQFSVQFPDFQIVSPLATQLSWSHIIELLPLQIEAQLYYMNEVQKNYLSRNALRYLISRKTFERKEIANTQLSEQSLVPFNTFKDPYLLDTLDLKDNYLEGDLERAILRGVENLFLEFGYGFALLARQKRIIIDGDDLYIDLLFYQREWRRLVAVELKIGEFNYAHEGQMKLYLKWLQENEMKEGEHDPIGLLLCTKKKRKQIEMLELDKSGIFVAEFWTKLPHKLEFEQRLQQIMDEAQENVARRKQLGSSPNTKQIEYFYETEDEGEHD